MSAEWDIKTRYRITVQEITDDRHYGTVSLRKSRTALLEKMAGTRPQDEIDL